MVFLPENSIDRVSRKLEKTWEESGAWPEYVAVICQTLSVFKKEAKDQNSQSLNWVALPGLCCQAAGGDPILADDIAAAWLLFYLAADLMDDIQDQDSLNPWWETFGTGVALNVASGLYFSASFILNSITDKDSTNEAHAVIVKEFYDGFMKMCGGQHQDLTLGDLTLDQFWNIASAKSGIFFSLACRGGAQLVTQDKIILAGFEKFGHHLGILVQILDDLEEIQPCRVNELSRLDEGQRNIMRSLPVVYALEVYPPSISEHLRICLKNIHSTSDAFSEAIDLINHSGAVLYVETEIERHREEALAGLNQAQAISPSCEILGSLIQDMYRD